MLKLSTGKLGDWIKPKSQLSHPDVQKAKKNPLDDGPVFFSALTN